MIIRNLSEEDINKYRKSVYEYIDDCLQSTYEQKCPETIESKIDGLIQYIKRSEAYVFGAIAGNQLIGFLWGYPVSSYPEEVFHVAYIAVREECRGKGIGTRLMNEADKKAEELGLSHIELIVSSKNENAINFYKNEGYKSDRIIMRKRAR